MMSPLPNTFYFSLTAVVLYWIISITPLPTGSSVLLPHQRRVVQIIHDKCASFLNSAWWTYERHPIGDVPRSFSLIRDSEWFETQYLRYSSLLCVCIFLGHALISALEGRRGSTTTLVVTSILLLIGSTFKDGKYLKPIQRVATCLHAALISTETLPKHIARRAITIRFLSDMCHIEALDEIFVHSGFLAYNLRNGMIDNDDEILRFVVVLFLVIAIPVTLVPIRGATARFLSSTNKPLFVGFLMCFTTLTTVFLLNFQYNMKRAFLFDPGPIVSFALVGSFLLSIVNIRQYGPARVFLVRNTMRESLPVVVCMFATMATTLHPKFDWKMEMPPLLATLAGVIMVCLSGYCPRILMLVLMHGYVLVNCDKHGMSDLESLLLMASSVLLGFDSEGRPLSVIIADSLLMVGIKVAMGGKATFLDVFGLFLCLSVALVTITLKDLAQNACKLEVQAQQFLDHALKQKFAGVTSAVEHTLELVQGRINVLPASDHAKRTSLNAFKATLEEALTESKRGHDLCFAANVIAKIAQGIYVSRHHEYRFIQEIYDDMISRVKQLNPRTVVELLDLDTSARNTTQLSLDWELLWLLVMLLVDRNPKLHAGAPAPTLVISLLRRRNGIDLCLRFSRSLPPGRVVVQNIQRLIVKMDATATYTATSATLMLQDVLVRDNVESQDENARTEISSALSQLPPRLVFAVLDDVSLVRKNLMRLLTGLKASPDSFAMGSTEEEVNMFSKVVMGMIPLPTTSLPPPRPSATTTTTAHGEEDEEERFVRPDVVIIDMYLEYDTRDDPVFGATVATDLRMAGFRGAIIMHSANENLKDSLDPYVFDGFLSKTFNKEDIAAVVVKALYHASRRKDVTGEGGGGGGGGGGTGGRNSVSPTTSSRLLSSPSTTRTLKNNLTPWM